MVLFILGVFVGGAIVALLLNSSKSKNQSVADEPTKSERPAPSALTEPKETTIHIPVEIMPNLYSLELHDVAMKHHIGRVGKYDSNYVTMGFRFSYHLNGRKEGKRRLIITSYNANGELLEIKGDFTPFIFTEAGIDVMQICFNNCEKKMPARITVLVREGAKD